MTQPSNETSRYSQWMAFIAAFLGWMFDGVEMGLFPLVATPAIEAMLGPENLAYKMPWITGITAAFLIGAAAGGIMFGWLGDRIGRVKAMSLSVLTYSIFSGLCGFSQTPWDLGALRFMAALGMGGEWALGVALIMEVWPAASRPTLAGFIGVASNTGFVLTGLMGLGLAQVIGDLGAVLKALHVPEDIAKSLLDHSGWRLLMFLGATPALLTLFIQFFVPESKRWQHSAATATRKNRISDIFEPGIARMTIMGTILAALVLLGTWGSVQMIPNWAAKLTKEPTARALCVIWCGAGAIVATLMAAWLAQLTSRRMSYFVFSTLSLFSCQYLFRADIEYGNYFLFWVTIVGGTTASFYGWLPLYLPELFPTRCRATGQGFAYNIARIVAAIGTIITGFVLNIETAAGWANLCAMVSLVYIIGMVFIWFCPETKGKPLPE